MFQIPEGMMQRRLRLAAVSASHCVLTQHVTGFGFAPQLRHSMALRSVSRGVFSWDGRTDSYAEQRERVITLYGPNVL